MNNEKVKSIKKALEFQRDGLMYLENNCVEIVYCKDILALINELESENERLKWEKQDLRLFDIALGNGKVDMTLGGNTAKSFINAIVQIFEQNNATNFLATTIESVSSGNKYSLVIQKENGQTPSEKLTELKDRIALLEKENETLRNAKVVYETVDYCAEDLRKAEKRIKELEKENRELLKENEGYRGSYRCAIDKIGELSAERYIEVEQFAEILKQMPFNIEFTFKESSYEDIKKLANLMKEYLVEYIDETLKEFIVI